MTHVTRDCVYGGDVFVSQGITLQEAASEIVSLKCSLQLSGELANQLFH
jgi:hypothetical protein